MSAKVALVIYLGGAGLGLTVGIWFVLRAYWRRMERWKRDRGDYSHIDMTDYVMPVVVGAILWPLLLALLPSIGIGWLINHTARKSGQKAFRREVSLRERERKVAEMERELGL